jgi:hypothetical protein
MTRRLFATILAVLVLAGGLNVGAAHAASWCSKPPSGSAG